MLRALVLLAAVTPVFEATGFVPTWWQVLLASAIGSALGELAVRLTRNHRPAQWSIAVAAVIAAGVAASWSVIRSAPSDSRSGAHFVDVTSPSLTSDDIRALRTELPPGELVASYVNHSEQLSSEEQNWNTLVVGSSPDYFEVMGLELAAGDRFEAAAKKVVVLGETAVKSLFGAHSNPVGEEVRIRNMPFTIIGVLAHRGMSPAGQDLDDVALVPLEIYSTRIDPQRIHTVVISPGPREGVKRVEANVRALLRDRHRLVPGEDDDFTIHSR